MHNLPLALLGIRSAVRADLDCSVAELLFGTTLRLTGEFFTSSDHTSFANAAQYVLSLRTALRDLRPTQPRTVDRPTYVSKDLASSSHVFIRTDAVRKPLQPPYQGPYKVLERHSKHFLIDIAGKRDTVALDRLKPAHLPADL